MRISHFFIDRPIFAAVVSIVFVILGAVSLRAAAGRAVSRDRAAGDQRHRPVSRRQRRGRGLDRGGAARAADQRRREHALHLVELDGRRPLLDFRHLRSRHQPRYRAGAGAEPRRHRAAAAAGGRAQHRRHGRQGLARPDDGGASLFAGQVARHAVHLQLRQRAGDGRAEPHRRRRLDHRVRQPRLLHAGLARPRPAAIAGPDVGRRGHGAAGAERAGGLGRAQSAAGGPARRIPDRRADARAPRRSQPSSAISSSSRAKAQSCASRTWPRSISPRSTTRPTPISTATRPSASASSSGRGPTRWRRRRRCRRPWTSSPRASRRASSTPSSTIPRSSSSNR